MSTYPDGDRCRSRSCNAEEKQESEEGRADQEQSLRGGHMRADANEAEHDRENDKKSACTKSDGSCHFEPPGFPDNVRPAGEFPAFLLGRLSIATVRQRL